MKEVSEKKKIIAAIDAQNETKEKVLELVADYEASGADGMYIYNFAKSESEREAFISLLRTVRDRTDLSFYAGIYVNRLEDVKKAYYSGASKVVIDMDYISDEEILPQAIKKIGKNNVFVGINFGCNFKEETIHEIGQECLKYIGLGIYGIMAKHVAITPKIVKYLNDESCPEVIIRDSLARNTITSLLELPNVQAIATNYYAGRDIYAVKKSLKDQGCDISCNETDIKFDELKKNEQGLVPVIVQDYKTDEVLMMAYMNEEAFNRTIETGKMNYYSRSRAAQWLKGESSGHYQFVKSISVDCDQDTLLAKVRQVGAACHTGNYSCFYRDIFKTDYKKNDIKSVLDNVFGVIEDRKKNPREGSYTNYLFDKGIDKILKKCGEEATEIVIAAKNPDNEELRYEISDFMYHVMVLMAEKGLTWKDIAAELAQRE